MDFGRPILAVVPLSLLSSAAHAIAESSDQAWTPLPFVESAGPPWKVFLTSDPEVVYSSGISGFHRSADGGRHWRPLPLPFSGEKLVVDPHDPQRIFWLAWDYLMRSADGGRSWTVAWQNRESSSAAALLPSLQAAGRAYLASGAALWRSTDGGVTFQRRGELPGSPAASEIALEEAADGGLYLVRKARCGRNGCGPDWGVYRSADQGRTWTPLEESEENANVAQVEQVAAHPGRPETVYFLRRQEDETTLRRSDDRGATFTSLAIPSGDFELRTDAAAPEALYLIGNLSLYRSSDRGDSWQEVVLPIADQGYTGASFALASPGRVWIYRILYSSAPPPQAPAFGSADGGATWTAIPAAGLVAGYVSDLAIAGREGVLYAETLCSFGELRRSADGGATWETRSGVPAVFDNLVGDPLDGDTLFLTGWADSQEAILRSRDGGRSFQVVTAIEDADVPEMLAFVRGGVTHVVAAIGDGTLARSADGGDTWVVAPPQTGMSGTRFTDLAWDGQALYAFAPGSGVFRSDDGGATWQRRSQVASFTAAGGGMLARLDAANNQIAWTANGGDDWTPHQVPFPISTGGDSFTLEVDPRGTFYLRHRESLLRSRDRGRTWQALSQDLPWADGAHLVFDPQDGEVLYLGTTTGLFHGRFADPGLALGRGRFAARLAWRRNAGDPWQAAPAAAITDQTGIFSPFSSECAEVIVQIVDGRQQGGHFWVFVASMTDAELELEIRDRVLGEVWRHHQPAGQPRSLADPAAFPRLPQPAGGALPLPFGGGLAAQDAVIAGPGRYAARVRRPDPAGGDPLPVFGSRLFGDTAAFAFDNPQSLDLLVNVIDGRGINGKFWVFGGSMTDQEFALEIADLATGEVVWTRHHPAGSFAGFGDTTAF